MAAFSNIPQLYKLQGFSIGLQGMSCGDQNPPQSLLYDPSPNLTPTPRPHLDELGPAKFPQKEKNIINLNIPYTWYSSSEYAYYVTSTRYLSPVFSSNLTYLYHTDYETNGMGVSTIEGATNGGPLSCCLKRPPITSAQKMTTAVVRVIDRNHS